MTAAVHRVVLSGLHLLAPSPAEAVVLPQLRRLGRLPLGALRALSLPRPRPHWPGLARSVHAEPGSAARLPSAVSISRQLIPYPLGPRVQVPPMPLSWNAINAAAPRACCARVEVPGDIKPGRP
ncbi:hypothetical protein [Aquimonas sp.]|uniref:hypothetical protein n=1 Tax=Aquimonas sp. TaxID=1872588 RepID=UPI0037C16DA6